MKFPKDILIIDFEGLEEPVQIGAVLLDKETLEEKDSYSSYIFADLKGEVKRVTGISDETLVGAPSQSEVGKEFFDKFGTNVFLAAFVANFDIRLLQKILNAAGLDIKNYDYHVLDLWSVAYAHLIKQGYEGGIRSEEIFQTLGAKPRGLHDALEDCRIAADVLRKILLF